MSDCLALYVPSNLGETNLYIGIASGWGNQRKPFTLDTIEKGKGKGCIFDGYKCFIMANNVRDAQQGVIQMSRQLEERCAGPIQSNRLYFLPLFKGICYQFAVDPKKQRVRPSVRVYHYPQSPAKEWICKICASNLVQLQEALFSHEQNLLKKWVQVLNQRRGGM